MTTEFWLGFTLGILTIIALAVVLHLWAEKGKRRDAKRRLDLLMDGASDHELAQQLQAVRRLAAFRRDGRRTERDEQKIAAILRRCEARGIPLDRVGDEVYPRLDTLPDNPKARKGIH